MSPQSISVHNLHIYGTIWSKDPHTESSHKCRTHMMTLALLPRVFCFSCWNFLRSAGTQTTQALEGVFFPGPAILLGKCCPCILTMVSFVFWTGRPPSFPLNAGTFAGSTDRIMALTSFVRNCRASMALFPASSFWIMYAFSVARLIMWKMTRFHHFSVLPWNVE